MGFYTPASLITPSAEEFIYSTPNIGGEIEIEFFVKNGI